MEISGDSDEFTNTMALGSSLIMRIATFWLLAVPGAALLLTPTSLAPAQSVIALRTPPEPRALLAETPTAAMAAVTRILKKIWIKIQKKTTLIGMDLRHGKNLSECNEQE